MRIIAHLDMDSFFASIEERDNPRLVGLPIVVGADPEGGKGRGVVSTANYAARGYGIHSALPIGMAWRLSEAARKKGLPPAAFLEVNGKKYSDISRHVMAIIRQCLAQEAAKDEAKMEQASVDEAYIDLSFLAGEASGDPYAPARQMITKIKQEIKAREHLTASVGVGPNKLISKIASDRQKPDGLTMVREEEAEKFLEPLSIRVIPGVGPKSEERLKTLRIKTVGDAKRLTEEELYEIFGKWGSELYGKLRGRDDAPLVTEWVSKSIGEQETFLRDTHDHIFLKDRLAALAEGVYGQFAREFKTFARITITVRFADFITKTRSVTLDVPANDLETLHFQVLRLFMPFLDRRENPDRKAFRLVGVRMERLE